MRTLPLLLLSWRRYLYVMSYALPRTSLGPACFRTLAALDLALEPRSWQPQALYVEFPELFDLLPV